jgi:hypothetical protein
MSRGRLGAAIAALALVLFASTTSSAGAATSDLIDASPDSVAADVPAPGHHTTWTMSATNVSDSAIQVGLLVFGESDQLFSGATPLTVTVADSNGSTLIEATTVGELVDRSTALGSLQAGESMTVTGSVALPRSAGNEYVGADGTLTFRFVATQDETEAELATTAPGGAGSSGNLAVTGASILGVLMIVGILLVVGSGLRKSQSRKAGS